MAEIRRKIGGFIWEQMDDSLAEQVRWEIHTAGGGVKISCSNWFSSRPLNPNTGWNVLAFVLHVSLSMWQPRDKTLGHAGGIFSLAHAGTWSVHPSGTACCWGPSPALLVQHFLSPWQFLLCAIFLEGFLSTFSVLRISKTASRQMDSGHNSKRTLCWHQQRPNEDLQPNEDLPDEAEMVRKDCKQDVREDVRNLSERYFWPRW